MRTSKPFSTISYNTDEFLKEKLDEMVKNRLIEFWVYINHQAEEDELKNHKHLYIIPCKMLDTDTIIKGLKEIDANNLLSPPLGCILPKNSKFDDWYLYSKHDKRYLASKGQARKYHYNDNAFTYSCQLSFNEMVNTIDLTALNRLSMILEDISDGIPLPHILKKGIVPLQQVISLERFYNIMTDSTALERNNRPTHTPKEERK